MKRLNFNFKHSASLIHLPKLVIALIIFLGLDLSVALHADAQGRGGSGRSSVGRSGMSHMGSNYGHMNGSGLFKGNFRSHGYFGYRGLPYWRYAYLPFWGDYYWGIPPYALRFYIDGCSYYDCDGVYYRYDNEKYQVVPAPIGYKVKTLPKGSFSFTLDGVPYYYFFGTYYTPRDGKYEVVQPPVGAEVDSIPDGYEKVMIDGQTYFTLNGIQYKAVLRDRVIWYRVIKNNGDSQAPSTPQTNERPMQDNGAEHK